MQRKKRKENKPDKASEEKRAGMNDQADWLKNSL